MASSIVKLNVGGRRFMTSRTTLEAFPDSFFTALLSGRLPSATDDKGYIFIDRNPVYFEWILDFMRTGDFNCPSTIDSNALKKEAQFYGITIDQPEPSLLEKLRESVEFSDHDLQTVRQELVLAQKQKEVETNVEMKRHEAQEFLSKHAAMHIKELAFKRLRRQVEEYPQTDLFGLIFSPAITRSFSFFTPRPSNVPIDAIEELWNVVDDDLFNFLCSEQNRMEMEAVL